MADQSYPEGVTAMDHARHDLVTGRFPNRSSVATFLKEREVLAAQEKVGHLPSGPSARGDDARLQSELAEALRAALQWIDAVPAGVRASLPAMPGFDRDWADDLLAKATGTEK